MSTNYEHRKSSARIRVMDANNNPLVNTKVNAKLVNHEFLFGCGAFDSLPATAEDDKLNIDFYQDKVVPKKEFYQDRVNKWLDVFNYGTIPFYWGGFEPEEGQPLTDSRMRAAKYLKEHGVRVKGHPLCWHTACADWLMEHGFMHQVDLLEKIIHLNLPILRLKYLHMKYGLPMLTLLLMQRDILLLMVSEVCMRLVQVIRQANISL